MHTFRKLLAGGLLGLLSLTAIAEEVFKFSVAPQFERRQLFAIWQPIVDALQQRTGLKMELVTALSVNDYEKEAMAGRYDFIYINPYMMPILADKPGYLPLVRDSKPLRGILVVRRDANIQHIEDLQGKTLAVPALTALGASLLLRAELEREFKVSMTPAVAKTHSSVFLHVINGLADAGGSVQKALSEQPARIQETLRILHQTAEVPAHPIAAHPRVPAAARERVRQALLALSADAEGRKLLAEVPMHSAITTRTEDYEILRALKLEKYITP